MSSFIQTNNSLTLTKHISVLLLFIFTALQCASEVLPAQGSLLNSKNIYFEENFVAKAVGYELQIFKDQNAFENNLPLLTQQSKWPAFKVSSMEWGQTYYWRVNALGSKHEKIKSSAIHFFSLINRVNSVHFSDIKIEVLKNDSNKHLGGLICIDYAKMICDRTGKTVWVMPEIPGLQGNASQIRDLKLTAKNTLTFLSDNVPLEIDLAGNVLWQLPRPYKFGNDTITFHHVFTKTKTGHYYVLGNRKVPRRVIGDLKKGIDDVSQGLTWRRDTAYKQVDIALVFEFDADGKVLWFWDANKYITDEDINFKRNPAGFPILLTHANGLTLNEEESIIYVSFRDLNRIIRIDKKSKSVKESYGEKYPSGDAAWYGNWFESQHDPNLTARKSLIILNNNGARSRKVSSIMEFAAYPKSAQENLIWKFDLNFDSLTDGKSPSGGNVIEMPNTNIFVCGGQLNRIFEVTRQKEIVWDAFLYSKSFDADWQKFPQYRASWIEALDEYHFMVNVKSVPSKSTKKTDFEIQLINTCDSISSAELEIHDLNGKLILKKKISALSTLDSNFQELSLSPKESLESLILTIRLKNGIKHEKRLVLSTN